MELQSEAIKLELDANKARRRETQPMYFEQNLFEKLCDLGNLKSGFQNVKKNRGAPGIDGVSIADFETRLVEELLQLQKELTDWKYVPSPVRRVEIPKPQGGSRLLGVPRVRDRVVQATIKNLLEPLLDPQFSKSSYGFRPGRNQKQAVHAAQQVVKSGKSYVVDIDLSKFFDRIHHDRLIVRLGKVIADKRILRLIGMILRSGVMKEGVFTQTLEGATQGSPLSPLLSNFVLDELDQELERKGLEFCRFADDCNIFTTTREEGERVMAEARKFIESVLKLQINEEKSKVAKCNEVKFLGLTIDCRHRVAISVGAMKRATAKAKELTPRRTHVPIEQSIKQINAWYGGWSNYFKMTEYPWQLGVIEAHIRRRLRARFIGQHKRRRYLYRRLVERGVAKRLAAKTVFSNRGIWKLSKSKALERAYTNKWFTHQLGFKAVAMNSDYHLHWYSIKTRPRWR